MTQPVDVATPRPANRRGRRALIVSLVGAVLVVIGVIALLNDTFYGSPVASAFGLGGVIWILGLIVAVVGLVFAIAALAARERRVLPVLAIVATVLPGFLFAVYLGVIFVLVGMG